MTVLLDTNIWRYLSDSGRGGELLRLAGKYPASIAICPTSVLEVQKLQNTSIKKNILNLMTNENLFRLSPDAYSESMEFIHAVIKLRYGW